MRLAPGAFRYAGMVAILGVFGGIFWLPIGVGFGILSLGILLFFRDPERVIPEKGFISPADGKVTVIREEGNQLRIGIFMNITDVHVNRMPSKGEITEITHSPGGHFPAFSKDAERNERVRIECDNFSIIMIAGTLARRITTYIETGETVNRGQRIGHIAFGSRVDVLLPPSITDDELHVGLGDSVVAGETVLANSGNR
ncbi:MAG: protein sorting system archaetidylserine decarboxylase [Halobacteriaceae archaeon]